MGCEIVVGGASAAEAAAITRLFQTLERALSRFLPDSDLQRLNNCLAPAVVVSPLLATALQDALDAAEATGGIVDPTIASALEAAGYDRSYSEIHSVSSRCAGKRDQIAQIAICCAANLFGQRISRPRVSKQASNRRIAGDTMEPRGSMIASGAFSSMSGDASIVAAIAARALSIW